MKVIIAGSRSFRSYQALEKKCDKILSQVDVTAIVSGTASGADSLGERYAAAHNISVVRMPADWDTHGKKAGYLRNVAMANTADALILFWDGKSRGSGHMLNIAREKGLRVRVVRI